MDWVADVTVDYIENPQDNYDKFLNKLVSLVTVTRIMENDTVIVTWSTLIEKNMDKFIQFASENWIYPEKGKDVYTWIIELHNYTSGRVDEEFYGKLCKFLDTLTPAT